MVTRALTYIVYGTIALFMALSGPQTEFLRSASARTNVGAGDVVQEIVICTSTGKKTILLDQDGNPTEQNQSDRSCCEDACTACGMCQSMMALPPTRPQVFSQHLLAIAPNKLREATVVKLTRTATARAPPGGEQC
ncbi:hypothetical protein PsAD2_04519 [Pseudovibrio axinellae]|uniref:Uncharacterized protein n=1 Tax=Pseudovibrio axinellae TaxID=989403 RepID=A0A165T1E7_9HYPH|nr:hypothetical protein [Pseudovibrio axinellae]KZL05164.1 hypothetical protein PsAD2_04519 [Pseudovibrio axinellae]SER50686.1 hypothetical protein SAMN05421798_11181 [Pseudovibrio axinellae]